MGFFDRFYYGKAGQADYTVDDMPVNRIALFFSVLRVRFSSLFRVNLMQLVFWIPFLLWTILNLSVMNNSLAVAVEAEGEALLALSDELLSTLSMYLLGLIPCLAITGPSSAGAAYVTRNWARDQHSFVWSDFKDAFKENWKQALGVSAITGIMPFLVYFIFSFYGQLTAQYPFLVVAQVLIVVIAVLFLLAVMIIYPMMVTYKLKFTQLWRNAFLIAVGRLPQMLLVRLLTLLPLILFSVIFVMTGMVLVLLIAFLYYALLGYALYRLVCASLANGLFDKFINPRIEGVEVNRGLRPEDAEDEDDDENEDEDA